MISSWFPIFVVLSNWTIRIIMIPIVVRRRTATNALAWLSLVFLLPWLGLFLYLLIGGRRLAKRRIKRYERVQTVIGKHIVRLALMKPHVIHPHLHPEEEAVRLVAEKLSSSPILGGNEAELLADTANSIERLIEDIDRACHHVHLLYYIYGDGEVGRRVAASLSEAVSRGVTCRVLVDAVGSRTMLRSLAPWMRSQGIQVHAMLPVNPIRRRLARLDLRNHRKLAIVDGEFAHTGSQNMIESSYGAHHAGPWVDLSVRLSGPILLQLQRIFVEDWYFATDELLDDATFFPEPAADGNICTQVVPSGPMYDNHILHDVVLTAIHEARRHLIITTPYFVPDDPVLTAIQLAALRGVKVDLVFPSRVDHPLVSAAMHAYFDELIRAGVNVYLYSDGLLHAKTMSVDESFAMIGSGNFDIRSFYLNFELNMLLYGSGITSQLAEQQQMYIWQSTPLDKDRWKRRSALRRFADDCAKLMSPLL